MSFNLYSDFFKVRSVMFGGDATALEKEYAATVDRCIEERTEPRDLTYLYIKISNYCNSDCEYCAHAVSRARTEQKHDIPMPLIQKALDGAVELNAQAVVFSGGEPLLREELYEGISFCRDHGIVPVVLTNGTLLDKTWERLGDAGLRYVIMSVDSVDPQVYEKHRGISFQKALDGIDAAVKMMEKYKGTEVNVSAVLERDNFDGFMQLVRFMNERNIKVQVCPLHDFFRIDDRPLPGEREKITAFAEQLIAYKRAGGLIASSEAFIRHLPAYFCDNQPSPEGFVCKIGYNSLSIDANMNVRCCWDSTFEPLGNLSEHTLPEIWHGEKMRGYRQRMLRRQCGGCWFMCTSENTLLIDHYGTD